MIRFAIGLLLALYSLAVGAEDAKLQDVRNWVDSVLTVELQKADPDLDLVASVGIPLVADMRLNSGSGSELLLEAVAGRMRRMHVGDPDCSRIPNLVLIHGLLTEAGIDPGFEPDTARLRACLRGATLFDLMNALILACGRPSLEQQVVLPGALQRLEAAHRGDGAFVGEAGREWFYLDSRGLLAMHLCGGNPAAVIRSRHRLEGGLPWLQRRGMIDELVEVLLFLRLSGAPARDETAYLRWLADRRQADGGLCFRDLQGCRSHWRPVSMYFGLLLERRRRGSADTPG